MSSPTPPLRQQPLAQALLGSEPLGALLRRLRESEARWATVQPVMPAALRQAVRAGPLDDSHWTLIAPHAAAAAKLRQLAPALEAALAQAGWPARTLRIRVGT